MNVILRATAVVLATVTVTGCMIHYALPEKYNNTYATGKVRNMADADDLKKWDEFLLKFPDTPSKAERDRRGFGVARVTVIQQFGGRIEPGAMYFEGDIGRLSSGDLVAINIPVEKEAELFSDYAQITKILCRAQDTDFDACAAKHPTGFYDKVTGKRID